MIMLAMILLPRFSQKRDCHGPLLRIMTPLEGKSGLVSLFGLEPFLRPGRRSATRRAQLPSRIAPATAERGAEGVPDGSEHGATIPRLGD